MDGKEESQHSNLSMKQMPAVQCKNSDNPSSLQEVSTYFIPENRTLDQALEALRFTLSHHYLMLFSELFTLTD